MSTEFAKPCAVSCQQGVKHRSPSLSSYSHKPHLNDMPTCATHLMLFKFNRLLQQNPQNSKIYYKRTIVITYTEIILCTAHPRSSCLYSRSTKSWQKFLKQLHAGSPSGCGLEGANSFCRMGNFCLRYNCSYSNSTRSRINSTFQFLFSLYWIKLS